MIRTVITLALACLVRSEVLMSLKGDQIPTGFRASIELDVLKNAANVWFDTIIQLVNGLKLPDINIDDKGDYMKDNTFYI